jgi:hypothetical protein
MGIKLGSADIAAIFLGSTEIASVYFGSTQIWPGGAPSSPETWDASRKAAFVMLSGGDLVATIAGQGKVAALAPQEASTANYYWEIELTTLGQYLTQGIMAAGASTYTGTLGQSNGGEYGVVSFQGFVYFKDIGTAVSAFGYSSHSDMSAVQGDVVKMYLINGALYYGRVGHGWYDASSLTYVADIADADPFVTGLAGLWSPAESTGSGGATGVATAHFAAADWVDTPPSGAGEWPGP